jgi:RHS repeat-associated protein
MRIERILTGFALACSCLPVSVGAATSLGRSYSFGFENGNLLRNWSFERTADNWQDDLMVGSRIRAKSASFDAVSGSYVGCVYGTNSTGSTVAKLSSELFPVEESKQYTLSFYVKNTSITAGVHPIIWFYSNQSGSAGALLASSVGTNYTAYANWTLVSLTVTSPAKSAYAKVALAEMGNNQGGTFYFDDVVLEKAATATDRTTVREAVSFFDGDGQVLESQMKIAGGGNNAASRTYLVQATELDAQRRPIKSYSPFLNSGNPDYDAAYATKAATYNNGSNGMESQGSTPFSKAEYWNEPGDPVSASYQNGDTWSGIAVKSGSYFVGNLTVPANPQSPPTDNNEQPYLLSWNKDVEDRYSYSWTNQRGELVQTAVKSGSNWLYTRYEYFPDGRLKKTLTPLDVPGDPAHQEFREITNYNSAGQVISSYTKDRGLRKFWYNRLGNMRFSRHEAQANDEYDFTDYDFLDRPISTGTQVVGSLSQSMVDQRSVSGSNKVEQKGYLYDNLDAFASRTGFALSAILPGKTVGVNGHGRLVCDFNFNRGVGPAFLTAQDKFIATFYNYNKYGEVTETYKFIGPIRDVARKIHKATYAYDGRHRLLSMTLLDNQTSPATLSFQQYTYDALDRVVRINGLGGKLLSTYQYNDWGGIKNVVLGSAATGTRVDYVYHARGWLKAISAVSLLNGHFIFQQFLGYEGKSLSSSTVPAPLQARLDGSISQQLYKYTSDMNSLGPVRMFDYQYDDLNRVVTADARKNSNANPLSSNQAIVQSSLAWTDTEDMDTRATFDDVGRMQTHRNGVSAADAAAYSYQADSYKLDHVTGKLSSGSARDASPAGTFEYDGRGRMTADNSKKMHIHYGWDDMPVEFAVESPSGFLLSDLNFYDADGQRITRLQVETPMLVLITAMDPPFLVKRPIVRADEMAKPVSSISDVNLIVNGNRRWAEQYADAWQVASSSGSTALSGISGQIGEITSSGTYRFFIKNNLGSTVATVDDQGGYASGRAMDYLSYGSSKDLKTNGQDPVAQKFTGKELELATGLYAFGARWFDPELALWASPDPARQFSNPYSYGGNPINGVDPDGTCIDGFTTFWCAVGIFAFVASTILYVDQEMDRAEQNQPGENPGVGFSVGSNGFQFYFTNNGADTRTQVEAYKSIDPDATASAQNETNKAVDNYLYGDPVLNFKSGVFIDQSPWTPHLRNTGPATPEAYPGWISATNRIKQGVGDQYDYLQVSPQHQFNVNVGRPTGRVVATLPTLVVPGGREIRALQGTVRAVEGIEANVFVHSLKYAPRVRMRALEDPVSHNFPYSFDDLILNQNAIPKNNGYRYFQQEGFMNGKQGVFEIGVTKDGIIDHRFFRPY